MIMLAHYALQFLDPPSFLYFIGPVCASWRELEYPLSCSDAGQNFKVVLLSIETEGPHNLFRRCFGLVDGLMTEEESVACQSRIMICNFGETTYFGLLFIMCGCITKNGDKSTYAHKKGWGFQLTIGLPEGSFMSFPSLVQSTQVCWFEFESVPAKSRTFPIKKLWFSHKQIGSLRHKYAFSFQKR